MLIKPNKEAGKEYCKLISKYIDKAGSFQAADLLKDETTDEIITKFENECCSISYKEKKYNEELEKK